MAPSASSSSPWDDRVTFGACCDFFEKVSAQHERATKGKRQAMLASFLRDCRKVQTDYGGKKSSLFPIMRLLLPYLDKERGAYGIKESVLADLYIDFLRLGKNSSDAQKLKNFRAPKRTGANADAGDFAATLHTVIRDRHYGDSKITVAEVNERLDEMVAVNANEGRRGVERILMDLFKKMSDVQQKWLVRLILKDSMKLGLGQVAIFNHFHPDAKGLYDVNANLRKVCELLNDPTKRMNEIEVQLFNPFRPMLADRGIMKEVEKQMGDKEFYIEVKYDGERLQVHKERGKFQFFSRNGFDFTDDFGASASDAGKFSSFLADALLPSVQSVILDGEICAFNHQTEALVQKGEQMNIRSLRPDDPMFQQCLYIYDVVYLNGKVLTNKPLKDRIATVESIVKPMDGRVQFADRRTASKRAEVVDALNQAIDRREEGIVLKDPESVYKPNVRSRGGWLKIKPEYSNELMDQCDLIVMGGYYGSGKRGGIITHFLLGLEAKRGDDGRRVYHSFCRVGSGYSMKELNELLQKLQPHFRRGRPPADADFVYEMAREKPDATIDPKNSVILQVKAAEIVASDVYQVGCTLRFPRVEKVRYDKSWTDSMTVEELETLRKQAEGKLTNRHLVMDDDDDDDFWVGGNGDSDEVDENGEPVRKRRKKRAVTSRTKVAHVPSKYRGIATGNIMVETHDLKDKVIVVEPANSKLKSRLEAVVAKHGGKIEQNTTEGRTFCYVETGYKLKAKNVAKSGKFDVVRSGWLVDCEADFRPMRPADLIVMTDATKAKFADAYDAYGDGYADPATIATLKYSMGQVKELGEEANVTHALKAEFENHYFDRPLKCGLFRQRVIYFDKYEEVGKPSTAIEFHPLNPVVHTAAFYGAKVVDTLEPRITHVVVSSDRKFIGETEFEGRIAELKRMREAREEKFRIVSEKWIDDSVDQVSVRDEADYLY